MDNIKYNNEDLTDHPGVSAVIKNSKGQILMQEHVKFGFWTIPVGKVKINQNIIEGLKEEVFEETNLIVNKCKELKFKVYEYLRNGKKVKVFAHLFEITDYSGKLENKEPNKHKNQKFMDIAEIINLPYISDTTLLYLETLGIKRDSRI